MPWITKDFTNVPATGQSDVIDVSQMFDKWVALDNLSAGTVNIQGRLEANGEWYTLASRVAVGDDIVEVPQPVISIRLDTNTVTMTRARLRAFQ